MRSADPSKLMATADSSNFTMNIELHGGPQIKLMQRMHLYGHPLDTRERYAQKPYYVTLDPE